jgi:hypothetical protein
MGKARGGQRPAQAVIRAKSRRFWGEGSNRGDVAEGCPTRRRLLDRRPRPLGVAGSHLLGGRRPRTAAARPRVAARGRRRPRDHFEQSPSSGGWQEDLGLNHRASDSTRMSRRARSAKGIDLICERRLPRVDGPHEEGSSSATPAGVRARGPSVFTPDSAGGIAKTGPTPLGVANRRKAVRIRPTLKYAGSVAWPTLYLFHDRMIISAVARRN